jgi:hypothetical protein
LTVQWWRPGRGCQGAELALREDLRILLGLADY